jgi:hypothetical protein
VWDRLPHAARVIEVMRSFRIETQITALVSDCFDVSLSVDGHAASMKASGERGVSGFTSGVLRLGDTVT